MSKRRSHGDGGIDQRGENSFRLRYRLNGKRYSQAFRGTLSDAKKKLRALIGSGDAGTHVEPDKITVAEWIERWLAAGAPGRSKKKPGRRRVERYGELMHHHVVRALGTRRLQQLNATEIDELYVSLGAKLKPRTAHHVHVVLGACLAAAVRKKLRAANPMDNVEAIPPPVKAITVLRSMPMSSASWLDGFRGSMLFPIIATAALTGAQRNEIRALRWTDFDAAKKTLSILRALEETKAAGLTFKAPKTKRGTRTIAIDDELVTLLTAEREKHLRIMAGAPDTTAVDLSLVKLPEGALVFPSPAGPKFDFTRPRDPHAVTRGFKRHARRLGFKKLRFHDLRGSHETALLDARVPVHYAKRTGRADKSAAAVIGSLSKGILG
jgi:integrase